MFSIRPRLVVIGTAALLLCAHSQAQMGEGLRLLPRTDTGTLAATLGSSARGMALYLGSLQFGLAVGDFGGSGLSARLTGDYYLTGPGFGEGAVSGGLRLSSGVRVEPRQPGMAASNLASALRRGMVGGTAGGIAGGTAGGAAGGAAAGTASWIAPTASLIDSGSEFVTLPYIGLGYTSLAVRAGWGLSADIGLGGKRPGLAPRLGSSPATGSLENLLNDLRLAPVIHLGVSYAF